MPISEISNVEVINEPIYLSDFYRAITRANLLTAISNSTVLPNGQYRITDPVNGGQIIVNGAVVNNTTFNASWIYTTKYLAFGFFRLASGNTGSISVLTVNGTSVISAPVPYNTSLTQTITDLAANINAFTGTSGYRGYAINDVLVIEYQTPLTASNGWVLSVTTTGTLVADNINNLRKGADPVTDVLPIIYDIQNDHILWCRDRRNNELSYSIGQITAFGFNPITVWRWNDVSYNNNYFRDVNLTQQFVDGDGRFSFNTFLNGGQCQNNLISGTPTLFQGNISLFNGQINRNYTIGNNSGWIQGNVLGPASTINNNQIISVASSAGILFNILDATQCSINTNVIQNGGRIDYNIFNNRSATINSNFLNGATNSGIRYNYLNGFQCTINSNSLQGTTATIFANQLNGQNTTINLNTVTNTNGNITNNQLTGASSTINSNSIGGTNAAIVNNCLFGASTGLNSNNLGVGSSAINGVIINAANRTITSFTSDTTFSIITRFEWTTDDTIILNLQSNTLNGAANNGLAGSPVNIGILPLARAYPVKVYFEGNGLVGPGSSGQVGIETDNTTCMLAVTAIGSLNAIIPNNSPTAAKSTVNNRRIQFIPTGANMTAGSIQVFAEFKISRY